MHLETFLQLYFGFAIIEPVRWTYRELCSILADPIPRLLVTRFVLGNQAHYTLVPEVWSSHGTDWVTLAEPLGGRLLPAELSPNGHVVHPDGWVLAEIYRIA